MSNLNQWFSLCSGTYYKNWHKKSFSLFSLHFQNFAKALK
jgi:hypothetical protein